MCACVNTGTAFSPVRSVRKIVSSPSAERCSRCTSAAGVRKVSVMVDAGPPPTPSHVVDRHRVLGVLPQRQPEAHADAATRCVDRERRLGGDGDLRRIDFGERLRGGDDEARAGCRDRRRRIHLHVGHTRSLGHARRGAGEAHDRERHGDDGEGRSRRRRPRRRRLRVRRVSSGARISTHTGPRARGSPRPSRLRCRGGRRASPGPSR